MKAQFNSLFLLIISLVFTIPINAQIDSVYQKHLLDSLRQVNLIEQKAQLKALKIARSKFLKNLDTYPSDSAFKLDISNMGFDVFPDISRFTNITYIQASGNNLRDIRLSSKNIKHLEVLDIRENNIETLHIGKAPNLKNAYLAANPLKRIPFSFVFNKKLEMIDISKTQISLLPWWLKYKKNITELIINGGIFEINNRNNRRMRQLKTLTLAHLKVDSLPNSFSKLHKLERLTIAYTHLHSLPDNFYKLKNLNTLILYSDAFHNIPTICYKLPKLKHLDFYFNSIRTIPNGIQQLENLEYLYLSFNQISILPPDIQNIKRLKYLYLHHNNIENTPQWLGQLDSLEILDMGFNDIDTLTDLSNLKNLAEVDFQNNQLNHFPFQLLELPKTRLIYLSNNPFVMNYSEQQKLKRLSKEFAKRGGHLILVNKKE
ncbi:MAG: hypothetical protein DSY76_02400 [Bacteroidetes bacterium]|nr:MAG: hypothetical protein DSY76_02400 [Bacteroidota bacterium]